MRARLRRQHERLSFIKVMLCLVLGINMIFWSATRDIYGRWEGVPPVPTRNGAVIMGLGDPEFAYRFLGLTLQNLGNVGRDFVALKTYNYRQLGSWFLLMHQLDPASDHLPMTAAYYFGGTKVPKDVAVVVDYLRVAGAIPVGEKWRWLAHASYLAQHRMHDLPLALQIAYQLVKMPNADTFPQWARQMPAFVLAKKGDKDAARQLMENMLLSEKDLHPAEVNTMKAFLTEQLGVPEGEVDNVMRMRGQVP